MVPTSRLSLDERNGHPAGRRAVGMGPAPTRSRVCVEKLKGKVCIGPLLARWCSGQSFRPLEPNTQVRILPGLLLRGPWEQRPRRRLRGRRRGYAFCLGLGEPHRPPPLHVIKADVENRREPTVHGGDGGARPAWSSAGAGYPLRCPLTGEEELIAPRVSVAHDVVATALSMDVPFARGAAKRLLGQVELTLEDLLEQARVRTIAHRDGYLAVSDVTAALDRSLGVTFGGLAVLPRTVAVERQRRIASFVSPIVSPNTETAGELSELLGARSVEACYSASGVGSRGPSCWTQTWIGVA